MLTPCPVELPKPTAGRVQAEVATATRGGTNNSKWNYMKYQCPSCGAREMYQRNALGPELWYCPNCEERFGRDELEEINYDPENDWDGPDL